MFRDLSIREILIFFMIFAKYYAQMHFFNIGAGLIVIFLYFFNDFDNCQSVKFGTSFPMRILKF